MAAKIRKILLGLFVSLLPLTAMAEGMTAIRAGHIVHPETGTLEADRVILIENGRIKSVLPGLPNEGVDTVIDLSDSYVLPGLMDMHTHLTTRMDAGNDMITEILDKSSAYRALLGAKAAKSMLMAGFTTVRDVGNGGEYADSALRRAISEGLVEGPTIYNAGKILSVFGGQTNALAPEHGRMWEQEYITTETPEDIRKAIHRNIYYGARLVKVVIGDQRYSMTEETLRAAVEEASAAGMHVAAHTRNDSQAAMAVRAGVRSIEHGFSLKEETLKAMAAKGVSLVGTEFPVRYLQVFYGEQRAKGANKMLVDQLKRAHAAGVQLGFGTDLFMIYKDETRGVSAINFIESWQAAGVSAAETLKAMTTNGAKILGIEKRVGAIREGMLADIIAVPGNPLEDIDVLKRVSFVMQRGRQVR